MRKKKLVIILVSVFTFLVLIGGTSYAYFVYNKDISNVSIEMGDISLSYSNSNNMTVSNLIPNTDALGKVSSNYIDFTVAGSVGTERVYYEVYIEPKDNSTMTENNINNYVKTYLTDQNDVKINNIKLYKNLRDSSKGEGKIIYQAIIEPNSNGTTKTENKDFRLRVWLKDDYTGRGETLNFNVYLYAINVDEDFELPLDAYGKVIKNVNTTTQINFANASSSTNGQGLYILLGTENDDYPIYYYRGAIDDNNVIFGGYCWQIVRTTDTGGIKMIYNGLPDISGSGDNTTYNCGTAREFQDDIRTTTSLQQSTGYYYADDYEIVSSTGNGTTYRLKSKNNPITQVAIANATDAVSAIPTIASNYPYTCKQTTDTGTCTKLYKVDSYTSGTNANVYSTEYRTIIGKSAFNSNYQSVSDVGYMSNTRYPYSSSGWTTDALFASVATWVTDHYELTDASVTTPDTTHHYSCNATTADATCTSLRYVHHVYGTTKYYITLTSGELIEDALYKMTGNGDAETKARNSSYNLNVNNSTAKAAIDNWFRTNLTSEVDVNNPDYSVYLEDTVYCNDRSYKTTGSSNTFTQSGWNPSGGSLSTNLYFGTWNRYSNSWYSTTNVPSILCPNETDRYTVSNTNGNGALTYPVGLLTADEIIMAGVGGNNGGTSSYYLYTNDYYWSLAPSNFSNYADEFVANVNSLSSSGVTSSGAGLRPVVSLKPGIEFEDNGDGTPTNPYVVKYD